jgi:hypothetical protein
MCSNIHIMNVSILLGKPIYWETYLLGNLFAGKPIASEHIYAAKPPF